MFDRLFKKERFTTRFGSFTPREFGYWSVTWVVDATANGIETMSEIPSHADHETLQHRISKYKPDAHFYLISYMLSAYYVYVAAILKAPKHILNELFIGYEEGLSSLNQGDTKISQHNVLEILNAIRRYGQKIYEELNTPQSFPGELRLDGGPAVAAVFNDIVRAYDPKKTLNIDPIDEMPLIPIIQSYGSMQKMNLINEDIKLKLIF
jgi:hypothetical protein